MQREFFLFKFFFRYEGYGYKREEGKEENFHFLLFEDFSLAASILKYSLTSSTRVSSFLHVALGVLF